MKTKFLAGALTAVVTAAAGLLGALPSFAAQEYYYEEKPYILGDINCDSKLDELDLEQFGRFVVAAENSVADGIARGDMDHDGALSSLDEAILRGAVLGIIPPETITPPGYQENEQPITAPILKTTPATPSTGDVKMLAFFVDFPNKKYLSEAYSTEQMKEELFGDGKAVYPYESVTAWFDRASYGNLHLSGDVYSYTCSKNMYEYQNDYGFEQLVMEVLQGLDSQIDYSDYDSNNDGIIDCLSFTIPLDGESEETLNFWWGCTATWYQNYGFSVDGMYVDRYIINDVMPYEDEMVYHKQTLIHEMGHSMGLPDYYKYETQGDNEGFHGDAGYAKMDDMLADYTTFDKIMLGWLTDSEIQKYNGSGEQTFELNDASLSGSCLILPISSTADDYNSEYFLVEYITDKGNNSDSYAWFDRSGVRIFHVQGEFYTDYWDRVMFKYENYSDYYMGDDKARVLRLVNDGNGFFHSGDTVSYGVSGFAAYDENGYETVNTGYVVTLAQNSSGTMSVTVSK